MCVNKYEEIASKPIFFERNRVFRVYLGGKLFHEFLGDEDCDSNKPEEWVASGVKALNRDSSDPYEGVSKVRGEDVYFDELLKTCKEQLLGDRDKLDILVKYLDSAIRLPVQAHPDKAFSRKFFNSDYGKTEAWLVLATRENAKIYFGFREGVTEEEFIKAIENSVENKDAMEELLVEIPARKGDVFLIPAKVVHAIGYGCMILEIQEPTDFTIQPEAWCGEYRLNDYEMYLGLQQADALKCFDFSITGDKALSMGRKEPRIISDNGTVLSEQLISYDDTPCFSMIRNTLKNGSVEINNVPAVIIVTEGNGVISGADYSHELKKGDYFFMPYAAGNGYKIATDSELQFVECLPSKK